MGRHFTAPDNYAPTSDFRGNCRITTEVVDAIQDDCPVLKKYVPSW